MASYKRFEDLSVWQKAARLGAHMLTWASGSVFRGKGDLGNQLQRAALSVSNNIAEGFERGTTKELIHLLYIARGSAAEVRSMLCVMDLMNDFSNLKSEISDLKVDFENVSRQLRGWTNSLQDSEIEGQRHLNDRSRESYERKQRRDAFVENQEEFRRELEDRVTAEAADRKTARPQNE